MKKGPMLKTYNLPMVTLFITWCIAVYATFQSAPDGFWTNLQSIFEELRVEDGIAMVLSPILVIVLTGILSPDQKALLVFWRLKHALPGHRAFSGLAPQDPRIDMSCLEQKLGEVPQDPVAQNSKWYSIYRKKAGVPIVEYAHKRFLLTRDLASVSALFSLFGSVGLFFVGHKFLWVLAYCAVMLVHYIALSLVARNHANRFVCNVLVEYLEDGE